MVGASLIDRIGGDKVSEEISAAGGSRGHSAAGHSVPVLMSSGISSKEVTYRVETVTRRRREDVPD